MDENEEKQPVNPAGMPEMHPPGGGPNQDPNVPDPGDLVPGRPGPPPRDEESDDQEHPADSTRAPDE